MKQSCGSSLIRTTTPTHLASFTQHIALELFLESEVGRNRQTAHNVKLALMTNERILCNYISSIKFHIEFADDDPPPFFDHVAFRHLMYQYFKPSICQGNFLSNLKTATDDELLGDILRSAYPRPVQNRSKETRNRLGKSAWQIALVAQKMPEAPTTERSPTYGYVVKALEEILEPLHSDESLRIWVKESIDSDEVTACSSQVSNHIQRMQGTIYKVLRLCRILYPAKLKRMLEYLNSLTVERTTKDSAMEGITKIDEDIFLGSL
eukprot:Gregarina_sp_Poly_1__3126@NODE_1882_length_3141_cov_39_761874_g1221_i0_p1_GENE_NODE_1882_length_3141_cov_39_761874_g1221_i0NODE_1882_length_3141_cov_39_761874_g1221_i0_p1_ORF_typecomplete_len265_score19_95_NODE_1882_length_3141_cov_39_761874_g1221_i020622856